MNPIEILKVIILGIIEGITEWLPVSSTGHMLLFDAFIPLNMSQNFKNMFTYLIQLGAIMAVVVIFWNKIFPFSFKKDTPFVKTNIIKMWLKVLIALIPTGIAGLLLDDYADEHFHKPLVIAAMLIIYGIAFILIENRKRTPKIKSIDELPYSVAFFIGCFQAISIIPGTSRSGATIIGALLLGVSRITSAEYTFFLAIPTMLGASLLKLIKFGGAFTYIEISVLILGMAVAFIVSMFSIRFLMNFIKQHSFKPFGVYRIILGLIVIVYSLLA